MEFGQKGTSRVCRGRHGEVGIVEFGHMMLVVPSGVRGATGSVRELPGRDKPQARIRYGCIYPASVLRFLAKLAIRGAHARRRLFQTAGHRISITP